MTMQQLYDLAVSPFPNDVQREVLYRRLTLWCGQVRAAGLAWTMWIDGSFLTNKPGPDDIDCVVWQPVWTDPAFNTPANQMALQGLFDHATARTQYGLDLYLETPLPNDLVHREAYWKGFFGYCHDRVTAKGFAEVHV